MAKDLKSFAKEKISEVKENLNLAEKDIDKVLGEHKKEQKDIQSAYNRYKNFSKDDLVKEFFGQIEEKKRSGNFNKSEIDTIAKRIMPMLSNEQKQMLNSLLGSI